MSQILKDKWIYSHKIIFSRGHCPSRIYIFLSKYIFCQSSILSQKSDFPVCYIIRNEKDYKYTYSKLQHPHIYLFCRSSEDEHHEDIIILTVDPIWYVLMFSEGGWACCVTAKLQLQMMQTHGAPNDASYWSRTILHLHKQPSFQSNYKFLHGGFSSGIKIRNFVKEIFQDLGNVMRQMMTYELCPRCKWPGTMRRRSSEIPMTLHYVESHQPLAPCGMCPWAKVAASMNCIGLFQISPTSRTSFPAVNRSDHHTAYYKHNLKL